MQRAKFKLEGTSPLVFGRPVNEEKMDEETPQQREQRTAHLKVFTDPDGNAAVNADAIKRSLEWAASWRNDKLPGGAGGKATFKKRFTAGVQIVDQAFAVSNGKARIAPKDVPIWDLYVPSDGQRGGKKRVWKAFPRIPAPWYITGTLLVLDQSITEEVFRKHLETAGLFDGLGSMRAGNGGANGRFIVTELQFEDALK